MKILVEDIPPDGLEMSFPGDVDVLSEALATVPALGSIRVDPFVIGQVHVARSGEDFVLTAAFKARTLLECARCLTQFELPVVMDTRLVLHPIATERPTEEDLVESDPDLVLFHGPEIDVGRIILQEILLEVPMKPLCKPSCPGLCSQCGAPKGSKQCTCSDRSAIDQRLEALATLKDKIRP
jgi:uncharacterized protein